MGGQEEGIGMKGAQSKVKWRGGAMGGGGHPPHSYATGAYHKIPVKGLDKE